ncbi:hypothetical protein JB92DRAFT_3226350 [Gautieria morchelliformis]|nr:hypothetical protein JB92DRAFT_3226350 [Gautieria morchelliformis]
MDRVLWEAWQLAFTEHDVELGPTPEVFTLDQTARESGSRRGEAQGPMHISTPFPSNPGEHPKDSSGYIQLKQPSLSQPGWAVFAGCGGFNLSAPLSILSRSLWSYIILGRPASLILIGDDASKYAWRNWVSRAIFSIPRIESNHVDKYCTGKPDFSRILAVDMLLSDIPINMITDTIVMHAEKVTALDSTAFITGLYRAKNQAGFLKAFSDHPEHITSGMSPLRNILKDLQTFRTSSLTDQYNFHEEIQKSLEPRKADDYELAQHMSESMSDIHEAIVNCMNATLNELKHSNTTLDLDALDKRPHLAQSWSSHETAYNGTGRARYLLAYDPLAFHAYLETIVASNSSASSSIYSQENQSLWLTMDAANTIFTVAKRRCYFNIPVSTTDRHHRATEAEQDAGWENRNEDRPWWLPEDISPILEEPPECNLLAMILHEIEEGINDKQVLFLQPGSDTVLVMSSSNRTCALLREYLDMLDLDAPKGEQGRPMMKRRLRGYLGWKADLLHVSIQNHENANHPSFKRDAAPILQEPRGCRHVVGRRSAKRGDEEEGQRQTRQGRESEESARMCPAWQRSLFFFTAAEGV